MATIVTIDGSVPFVVMVLLVIGDVTITVGDRCR